MQPGQQTAHPTHRAAQESAWHKGRGGEGSGRGKGGGVWNIAASESVRGGREHTERELGWVGDGGREGRTAGEGRGKRLVADLAQLLHLSMRRLHLTRQRRVRKGLTSGPCTLHLLVLCLLGGCAFDYHCYRWNTYIYIYIYIYICTSPSLSLSPSPSLSLSPSPSQSVDSSVVDHALASGRLEFDPGLGQKLSRLRITLYPQSLRRNLKP